MKKIDGPSPHPFRVSRGQPARLGEGRIHVQSDLLEGSPFQELINTGQSRVSLAHNLRTFAGWSNAPLVKGAVADRVFNLQRVQRQAIEPEAPLHTSARSPWISLKISSSSNRFWRIEPEGQEATQVPQPLQSASLMNAFFLSSRNEMAV